MNAFIGLWYCKTSARYGWWPQCNALKVKEASLKFTPLIHNLRTSKHAWVMDDFWRWVIGFQLRFDVVDNRALSIAKVTVRVHQVASVDHMDRKQISDDVTVGHEGDLHRSSAHLDHSDQWLICFVWQSQIPCKLKPLVQIQHKCTCDCLAFPYFMF